MAEEAYDLSDLDCWVEFVDKGQWFMVWECNWAALFSQRPEFIRLWPAELLRREHWLAAIKADRSLREESLFVFRDNELVPRKAGRVPPQIVEEDDDVPACHWLQIHLYKRLQYLKMHKDQAEKRWKGELPIQERLVILGACPELAESCDWDAVYRWTDRPKPSTLVCETWCMLLAEQPQFAKHCRGIGIHCKLWDEFDYSDWWGVLKYHGDFAWRCPERLRKKVDERDWFWRAADEWHMRTKASAHMSQKM